MRGKKKAKVPGSYSKDTNPQNYCKEYAVKAREHLYQTIFDEFDQALAGGDLPAWWEDVAAANKSWRKLLNTDINGDAIIAWDMFVIVYGMTDANQKLSAKRDELLEKTYQLFQKQIKAQLKWYEDKKPTTEEAIELFKLNSELSAMQNETRRQNSVKHRVNWMRAHLDSRQVLEEGLAGQPLTKGFWKYKKLDKRMSEKYRELLAPYLLDYIHKGATRKIESLLSAAWRIQGQHYAGVTLFDDEHDIKSWHPNKDPRYILREWETGNYQDPWQAVINTLTFGHSPAWFELSQNVKLAKPKSVAYQSYRWLHPKAVDLITPVVAQDIAAIDNQVNYLVNNWMIHSDEQIKRAFEHLSDSNWHARQGRDQRILPASLIVTIPATSEAALEYINRNGSKNLTKLFTEKDLPVVQKVYLIRNNQQSIPNITEKNGTWTVENYNHSYTKDPTLDITVRVVIEDPNFDVIQKLNKIEMSDQQVIGKYDLQVLFNPKKDDDNPPLQKLESIRHWNTKHPQTCTHKLINWEVQDSTGELVASCKACGTYRLASTPLENAPKEYQTDAALAKLHELRRIESIRSNTQSGLIIDPKPLPVVTSRLARNKSRQNPLLKQ